MGSQREPRLETVKKLTAMVRRGDYCALLGPPRRGKTRLLRILHEHLTNERRAMPEHIPVSVFVDLRKEDPDSPWTLRELINKVFDAAMQAPPFSENDSSISGREIEGALRALADVFTPRLAVLLSPIDAAGEDVARDLLEALGTLHDLEPGRRPGVVIGGSLDLVHLTHGETSPFNMAIKIFLEPAVHEESAPALKYIAQNAGIGLPDRRFQEAVLKWTDGQWDLMQMLIERMRDRGLKPTVRHLEAVLDELEIAFRSGAFDTRESNMASLDTAVSSSFLPVRETLQLIEARPEWLGLVAQLCSGKDLAVFGGGRQDPRMCVALRQVPNGYTFSTILFERVFRAHFSSLHIADRLVLQRRWREAVAYYEKAQGAKPRGPFRVSEYTLSDLVYAAFGTVSAAVGEKALLDEAAQIVYLVLGVKCACILQGTRETSGGWQWEHCAGQCMHATANACGTTNDLIHKWAEISLRRGDPSLLAGGRIVIDTVRLPDEGRCLALCTATEVWRQSDAQIRAMRMLLGLCAKRHEESHRLAKDEQEIEQKSQQISRQAEQLALARALAETSQSTVGVERVVKEVLKSFEAIGFPHVMISFLNEQRNRVEAYDASGDMRPLVPLTVRDLHGEEVAPDDDILVYVVKTGEEMLVQDCFDPKYRCDQFAVRQLNPPLLRQIVFPLKGREGVGWRGTNVFGTVAIGRVSESSLPQAQQNMLKDLVGYASVALYDALLSEERHRLLGVRDRQIEMIAGASRAAAKLEDVDNIVTTLLEAAVENLNAFTGSIRLYDPMFQCLVCRAFAGSSWKPKHVLMRYACDEYSTAGWIFTRGKSLRNDDVSQLGVPYLKVVEQVRSNCGVPIFVSGAVDGALVIDADQVRAFTDEDVRLLEAFASLTGSLIQGGRAFALDSARSKVSRALAGEKASDHDLQEVAKVAKNALRADDCSIFLRPDSGDQRFVLAASTSSELSRRVGNAGYVPGIGRTGWVAKHNRSLRTRPGVEVWELRSVYGPDLRPRGIHREFSGRSHGDISFVGVPVRIREECWGVLRCNVRFRGKPLQLFSHEDQEVLELIAEELGVALERRHMERARENMLAGVAHQMAAPVNAAMAALNDLTAVPHLTLEEQAQYLRDANDWMAESLKRLTMVRSWEQLRTRTLYVDKRNFRLRPILESIRAQRSQALADDGITFHISCSASLKVHADEGLLLQIVENLIDNAFYFTRDRIEVRCRRLATGDTRIEVRDNGPGLSAKAKSRCFEPRFTTRSERRGTEGLGLGLPITRELARLHGGDVRVPREYAKKKGRGSVFIVSLPRR